MTSTCTDIMNLPRGQGHPAHGRTEEEAGVRRRPRGGVLATYMYRYTFHVARHHRQNYGVSPSFVGTENIAELSTTSPDSSEVLFAEMIDRYLNSRGLQQKSLRREMAGHLVQSRNPIKRVWQVLGKIESRPTEDRMQAAIDLLSRAGPCIKEVALALAFRSTSEPNEDVAYVVAQAAGRASREMIRQVLALAGSRAMREAAAEMEQE